MLSSDNKHRYNASSSGRATSPVDTSILKPGCCIRVFSASGTPGTTLLGRSRDEVPPKVNPYPARPICRPSINHSIPSSALEDWTTSVSLTLGSLVTTEAQRHKVLYLLYHYRHLNGTDLTDLPYTDLITHRVRIAPGTKPASNTTQKRWPAHTE